MPILELLKKDHNEVKDLLQKISQTGGVKTRQRLFEKMKRALQAHSHAEEQTFYAALMKDDKAASLIMTAEVEHELVERLLQELSSPDVPPKRWSAKCKVLKELVQHHVKEEEGSVFKAARKAFNKSQMQEIGERFESRKNEELQQAG